MSESPHQQHPSETIPPTGTRARRAGAVVLVAVVVVALALVIGFLARHALPLGAPSTTSVTVPAGWHLYTDPDGYFTIAIPNAWPVHRDTGTATEIFPGGGAQVPTSYTRFGFPATSIPPTSLSVSMNIERLVSAAQRAAVCASWHPNTTFGGLPAMSYPPGSKLGHNWLVYTTMAIYQFSYVLPGDTGGIPQTEEPTPVPQATLDAAQAQVAIFSATFRPMPQTTIKC